MNRTERILIYCSGASEELLEKCPTEKSKYVGIGGTILFTGLLASFSSAYALYFVFDSVFAAIGFGAIWGLMIFNLDRFIVSSMRKSDVWYKEYLQALPRILLAVLIAMVIARPLEIKLFGKEIAVEQEILKEELLGERRSAVESRYTLQLDSLNKKIGSLKTEVAEKERVRDQLFEIARQEADGTGGSGKINPGPIYKIKLADAQRAETEVTQIRTANEQSIQMITTRLNEITEKKDNQLATISDPIVTGLSFQLLALDRLGQKYPAIFWGHIFIILLFIALELTPIFTKLMSNRGPYDDLLFIEEHAFSNLRMEKTETSDMRLQRKLATL